MKNIKHIGGISVYWLHRLHSHLCIILKLEIGILVNSAVISFIGIFADKFQMNTAGRDGSDTLQHCEAVFDSPANKLTVRQPGQQGSRVEPALAANLLEPRPDYVHGIVAEFAPELQGLVAQPEPGLVLGDELADEFIRAAVRADSLPGLEIGRDLAADKRKAQTGLSGDRGSAHSQDTFALAALRTIKKAPQPTRTQK